jgi:galactose mutarotase-like enzyme
MTALSASNGGFRCAGLAPCVWKWRADTHYVVLFDQLAEAVCVEPQTGPPDALTLEPMVVTPDRPLTATMSWSWRREE